MLAEFGTQIIKIPQPACLVQTGTDDQVPIGVPVGAHDLVAVTREDDHILACLPVYNAYTVVITCSQDPG